MITTSVVPIASLRRRPLYQLVPAAVLILLLAACGGGGDGDDDGNGAASGGDAPASDAADAPSGNGDYSVLMVSAVDTVTADGQLADLEAAGFEGFIKEGSTEDGFSVYRSGLSQQEAEDLLEEIREEVFPEAAGFGVQPGLVVETDVWFGEN